MNNGEKYILLDTFCGAGGATRGYQLAGFYVVGVDIKPQPRYIGDEFYQGDALEFIEKYGSEFDVIHASPPCQHYSVACRTAHTYHLFPDLLPQTRSILEKNGRPFIIENVPGAPMNATIILCGSMFGLPIVRHRLFELNPPLFMLTPPCNHVAIPIGVYGHGTNSWYRSKKGHNASTQDWRNAMGNQWMNRSELAESIPWVYTHKIGNLFVSYLRGDFHATHLTRCASHLPGG